MKIIVIATLASIFLVIFTFRKKTPVLTSSETIFRGKIPRNMRNPRPVRPTDQCSEGGVLKDSKCEPAVVEERPEKSEEPEEPEEVVEEKPVEEKGTCQCKEKRYANMDVQFGQDGYACILDREKNAHASRALCEDIKTKKRCLEEATRMEDLDGNPIGKYCKWIPE